MRSARTCPAGEAGPGAAVSDRRNPVAAVSDCGTLPTACRRRAFSLVEVLVVLFIAALLAGLVLGVTGYAQRKARESKAQSDMEVIQGRLQECLVETGNYPAALNDGDLRSRLPTRLRVNADGVPLDPWDEPYVYSASGRSCSLFSKGPDKAAGSTATDADNVVAGR